MASIRRNVITPNDAVLVGVVSAVAGLLSAFAGCSPTGDTIVDVVLCFVLGAVVSWIGASSPWWALLAAAALVLAGSIGGAAVVTAAGVVAVLGASWIGYTRANQPVVRAAISGLVVQAALRLHFDPFFLGSATVAAVAMVLIVATGVSRRQRFVRRRILWTASGVAAFGILASAGLGVALIQQRSAVTNGYRSMLLGLELVQSGDAPGAQAALETAARELSAAGAGLSSVFAQPARLVPGIAQNRAAAAGLLDGGSDTASGAAGALGVVDLGRLRVVDGVIDVAALADLAEPFAQLNTAVQELEQTLGDAKSEWLIAPVQERIETSLERAERLAPQAAALASAARSGPDMLGASGPRRYLLAFVNGAEARGQSGLMGNWSELTIDRGRLRISRSGITNDLQKALRAGDVFIEQTDEFFQRLGPVGAGNPPDEAVHPNLWANITSAPDMKSVGDVMAQLYEAEAGYAPDGVVVIDPAGIAALLAVTGPIQVDGLDAQLTKDNVERFLVLDQYEFAEGERKDLLEEVTDAAVDQVLGSTLPPPQQLAAVMSDAVLNGHISGWASQPSEQEVFELVGMDARLPQLGADGWRGDAIAVLSDNANPNKIDSFLHRRLEYAAVVDENTGTLEASVTIELTNDAPADGFEDYVIGNNYELQRGTNRSVLTVMSPHRLVEYRIDGVIQNPIQLTDHGWKTTQFIVVLPPGGSTTVEIEYRGTVAAGAYELLVRPQPLPNPDEIEISVVDPAGTPIVRHAGPILRRSILDGAGLSAWR